MAHITWTISDIANETFQLNAIILDERFKGGGHVRVMINDVGQRGHSLCLRNLLLVTGHDDSSIQGMYQYAYKVSVCTNGFTVRTEIALFCAGNRDTKFILRYINAHCAHRAAKS